MSNQPFVVIYSCSLETPLVFDDSGEGEKEAEKQEVGNYVFGSANASMAAQEMISFCGEHEERRGECPEEAEDQFLFDVGVDKEESGHVQAHSPGRKSVLDCHRLQQYNRNVDFEYKVNLFYDPAKYHNKYIKTSSLHFLIVFCVIFIIYGSYIDILKMDLTEKQLTLCRQLGSDLSAPPHLCQQALNFYQSYKLNESWPAERADLVLRVAYFLAEKAQVLYDRQGRRLKSVAISANAVLRDHPKHEQFLYHLREMLRSIIIPPQASHLQEEVSAFSRHLSFALTFLNKLRTTLRRIKINRKGQDLSDYQQLITRLLWLLFIDCRADLKIGTDIIQSTCLLSCVLGYYIVEKYQEEGIYSIYFDHQTQGCTLPNQLEELSTVFMAYFHIKDSNTYFSVYKKLIKYLQGLQRNLDTTKFFSNQNISKNIYIVQKLYEKKITDDRIDESTFLRGSSISNNRPARITPFGRRAPLAPKAAPALSHKILYFQHWEQGQQNKISAENRKQENSGAEYFNKLKLQPTPKGILIRATPMSEAMELYNWIFEKSGRIPLKKQEYSAIEQTFEVSVLSEHTYQSKADHCQLAGGLWKEAGLKFPQLSSRGLLLISVYITCHILNAPINDIKIPMQILQLTVYEVWEALDLMINSFEKSMPLSLKMNLLGLETSFVSHRLWNDISNVQFIQNAIKNPSDRLVKRLIHQGAYTLHFLAKKLQLSEDIEDISFVIFQHALQSQKYLLFEKMLQHLLVCSLYAASKVKQSVVKFNQILAALKQVLGLASNPFQDLVEAVKIQGKKQNIIVFYNIEFVPAIRSFLKHLRSLNGIQASPAYLNAKVRDLVPKEANLLSSPQMASYFAYCESPMLKQRCLREININQNGVNSTIRRQITYGLQDIEAKFGKFNGNNLKQTRKIKH